MRKLFKFKTRLRSWGDGCNLEGMFIEDEDVLNEAFRFPVVIDFGSVFGHFSDVKATVDLGDFTPMTAPTEMDIVSVFEARFGRNICGINPMDYLD